MALNVSSDIFGWSSTFLKVSTTESGACLSHLVVVCQFLPLLEKLLFDQGYHCHPTDRTLLTSSSMSTKSWNSMWSSFTSPVNLIQLYSVQFFFLIRIINVNCLTICMIFNESSLCNTVIIAEYMFHTLSAIYIRALTPVVKRHLSFQNTFLIMAIILHLTLDDVLIKWLMIRASAWVEKLNFCIFHFRYNMHCIGSLKRFFLSLEISKN